jgi:hypothetical protein
VLSEPVVGLAVEARKLLDDIRTYVAVFLLDALGGLKRRVGLAALSEERLYELGNVATCDRYALDRRADNVALGDRDDVGDTGTRVNDGACKRSVLDLGAGPYSPATLKDSNMISAVASRFSGGFSGCLLLVD